MHIDIFMQWGIYYSSPLLSESSIVTLAFFLLMLLLCLSFSESALRFLLATAAFAVLRWKKSFV